MAKNKSPAKNELEVKCSRAREVVCKIEELTQERKKFYDEHDELAEALEGVGCLEEHGIRLSSPFTKGNTQWGHGPVRRLVIELVDPPKEKSAEATPKSKRAA